MKYEEDWTQQRKFEVFSQQNPIERKFSVFEIKLFNERNIYSFTLIKLYTSF